MFFFILNHYYLITINDAKCDFKSQIGKFRLSTALEIEKGYFKYFAFDKEFFYYEYNIAKKDFDGVVEHGDGSDNLKNSYRFSIKDKSKLIRLIFDGAKGELRITEVPERGSLIYSCNKIAKNKLPKPKF